MNNKTLLYAFALSVFSFFATHCMDASELSEPFNFFSDMLSCVQPDNDETKFQTFLRNLPAKLETIDINKEWERTESFNGRTTIIKESIRTAYPDSKERLQSSYETIIDFLPEEAAENQNKLLKFQSRCIELEEVFRASGKPLEKSRSLLGSRKSQKSSGSRKQASSFSAKYVLLAAASLAVIAAGTIALYFLHERQEKTKNAVK